MEKNSELWVAFAGDSLTTTISVHKIEDGTLIKVIINGLVKADSAFIGNIVLASMNGQAHKYSIIDVTGMAFIDGISINEYAIELLIMLTSFAMKHDMKSVLVIDDSFVRDVLTDTLRQHRGFSRIMICNSQDFVKSDFHTPRSALV